MKSKISQGNEIHGILLDFYQLSCCHFHHVVEFYFRYLYPKCNLVLGGFNPLEALYCLSKIPVLLRSCDVLCCYNGGPGAVKTIYCYSTYMASIWLSRSTIKPSGRRSSALGTSLATSATQWGLIRYGGSFASLDRRHEKNTPLCSSLRTREYFPYRPS